MLYSIGMTNAVEHKACMELCLPLITYFAVFSCILLVLLIILNVKDLLIKGSKQTGDRTVRCQGKMSMMMSGLIERLRHLVGSNTWDYCVIWKLSEDQRFLEFVNCCCGGVENSTGNGSEDGEGLIMYPCKDVMFQHPRTTSCEALAQMPSTHPLDGLNMEILISNQPRWLNLSNVSDLNINQVIVGTKVLIPIPGGLVELFATKQVNEDQNVIEYVMDQCATLMEQEAMNNCNNVGPNFSENGFEELMNHGSSNMHNLHGLEHSMNEQQGSEKGSVLKQEFARADPVSDSDHVDELDDDPKYRRRAIKGQQAKNLVAERKRRKKLNERLYHLRSLVPNISKLDRAAILGDAIKYVEELKKEQDDLKTELERNSDDEGGADHRQHHFHNRSNFSSEVSNPLGVAFTPDYDYDNEKSTNTFHLGASETLKKNHDFETINDKAQQMEVQVEVAQLEGNDFFVKVFGEQKRGGFVRLMEALNCLGLEITNVNMTSCISLVSYVFIVKKRDSEIVQAEYLRDSLLEATRSQVGFWTEVAKASENNGLNHHHHQYQCHNHQHHLHAEHINHFHNHFHHLNN